MYLFPGGFFSFIPKFKTRNSQWYPYMRGDVGVGGGGGIYFECMAYPI